MPFDKHIISESGNAMSRSNRQDRIIYANLKVPYLAGGGAGAAVTTALTGVNLPADYGVFIQPGQDATAYADPTTKTPTGFNMVITPRLAANTLAAGTADVLILG